MQNNITEEQKLQLIARVARSIVQAKCSSLEEADTSSLLRFDSLDQDVLTACMNEIAGELLFKPNIAPASIEIKLPAELVDRTQIRYPEILFYGNAGAARNLNTEKHLLLFANGSSSDNSDTIDDTLKQVGSITEQDLLRKLPAWSGALVECFPSLLADNDILRSQLIAMFGALCKVMNRSLRLSTTFLLNVIEEMQLGNPIVDAVNNSLHLLMYPKYINAFPSRGLDDRATWQNTFEKIKKISTTFFADGIRPFDIETSDLKNRLDRIRDVISTETLAVYESIIREDGVYTWSSLLELDWENDHLNEFLQETKTSSPKKDLGSLTLEFFESDHYNDLDKLIPELGMTIREFLQFFSDPETDTKSEETIRLARLFYSTASSILANDPKLDRKWDTYLFKKETIETSDFIEGLLRAAQSLASRVDLSGMEAPVLLVRCRTKTMDFFQVQNEDMLGYFSSMYRGLETQCRDFITFRFEHLNFKKTEGLNPLFHFDRARQCLSNRYKKPKSSNSVSKKALQLSFQVYLVDADQVDDDVNQKKTVRIDWSLPRGNIALSLARDLAALMPAKSNGIGNALKVIFGRNFKQANSKGLISDITLADASSFGLTSSTFLARNISNQTLTDLQKLFNEILADESLGVDNAAVRQAWDKFVDAYREALEDFRRLGLSAPTIVGMYESYTSLLKVLSDNASKSQHFRSRALSYALSIGVFSFVDEKSAYAVVAPWNPIRLFELHRDFISRAGLVKALLRTPGTAANVTQDLLQSLSDQKSQRAPSFVVVPENVSVAGNDQYCKQMLTPVEHAAGYTLYSMTIGTSTLESSSDLASIAELADVVKNYMHLMPQATNCLRILLPDVASKRFPLAVMKTISEALPDSMKMTFTVGGLNADNYSELTEETLYRGLAMDTAQNVNMEEASLFSTSLLSRIQFRVFPSSSSLLNYQSKKDGTCPFDLAFLDRFFTYNATYSWTPLPRRVGDANPYNVNSRIQQLSRRLVRLEEEFKSTTLLPGNALTEADHQYIDAVSWLTEGCSAQAGDLFRYPCLVIDCSDSKIKTNIHTLHEVAQWVVTSNDLIDRRQLINNHIKIVRYKRNAKTGKMSIVSSEMPTDVLTYRIKERILSLGSGFALDQAESIAEAILNASYRISGYVALRAARHDISANEIIGLVLSNWIAQSEMLSLSRSNGEEVLASTSFLVDDYAALFKNEQALADLVCLALTKKVGRLRLHIHVTEAKFRSNSILSTSKRESSRQVSATVRILRSALTEGQGSRSERPIWLARLADMVMAISKDDVLENNITSVEWIELADRIKRGDVDITLNGTSHVFIHDEGGDAECDSIPVAEDFELSQMIFRAGDIAKLLRLFPDGTDPSALLRELLANQSYAPSLTQVNLVNPWGLSNGITLDWVTAGSQTNNACDTGIDPDANEDLMTDPDDDDSVVTNSPSSSTSFGIGNSSASNVTAEKNIVTPQRPSVNETTPETSNVGSSTVAVAVSGTTAPSSTPTGATTLPPRNIHSLLAKVSNWFGQTTGTLDPTHGSEVPPIAPIGEPKAVTSAPVVSIEPKVPATGLSAEVDDSMIFAPSFAKLVAQKGGNFSYSPEREEWGRRATRDLCNVLISRNIPAKVIDQMLTPNGCLVCLEGHERLVTREILNLSEYLLTTKAINIVFAKPSPGKFLILFNNASGHRESVSMWNAWSQRTPMKRSGGANLSFIVGLKETDGQILYLNPVENDPHTLIAGDTGSGKTVLMQTMLLDMAATNPSNRLKFYIIDPKNGIDYAPLCRLPHMAAPLVNTPEGSTALLQDIVVEMERRYQLFAHVGAKNLARYNAKVSPADRLPALFVVHDEFPNWMVMPDYAKSVTEAVTQLATKSRAAGIYLIFMAQRPDRTVMPMQVRDNLGNRLVLKLPANTSEIALGEKGAENLLGQGHMAARLSNTVYYAQVPFLDEEGGELDEAVDAIIAADAEWR